MVPARGWQVVRYKPLNELLRKTQRREVGGLHRGEVWAQDSVLHGAGRPSLVLRMSSEVGFTRERGGRGGRHEQAVPYSAAAAAARGVGAYFFFWSPEVRRPLPAVRAGGLPSPPTLGRAFSRRRRARPNHSSRHRWLRIRRGLVRRPGPERSDRRLRFLPPATGWLSELYLPPPSLSGHRWGHLSARGPGRDTPIPRLGAGGTGSDGRGDTPEPTTAGARGAAGGGRGAPAAGEGSGIR